MRILKVIGGIVGILIIIFAAVDIGLYKFGDVGDRIAFEERWAFRLNNHEKIRSLLTTYHGEFINSNIMIGFVAWSISNKSESKEVVSELPPDKVKEIGRRAGFMAIQSGQETDFLTTFGSSEDPFYIAATEAIREGRRLTTATANTAPQGAQ